MSGSPSLATQSDSLTHRLSCYSDYRYNEFDGYEHNEWQRKRVITADTKAALEGTQTKVIQLVTGMFHGWLLIPDRTCAPCALLCSK